MTYLLQVPYSYVTESGEKYEVLSVAHKNNLQIESGFITFANGDSYEGDWSGGAKNGMLAALLAADMP